MSSLFKQFNTDKQKEEQGVEIQYAPNDDGSIPTFRVLRSGISNQRWAKALERESAPYRRLIDLGALDTKLSERIMLRVFVTSVLVGWTNIQSEDGKDVPYSQENAQHLFERLPELYFDLSAQASKLSNFRIETLENDAKN